MREIKFRAWNGYRMLSDETLRKNAEKMYARLGMENQYMGDIMIPNDKDLVVMQYTGLKDKNGKEIYEGDIVKYESPYFKVMGRIILGFYVEWFISKDAKDKLGEIRSDLGDWVEEIEVIGNIYENIELLNNK